MYSFSGFGLIGTRPEQTPYILMTTAPPPPPSLLHLSPTLGESAGSVLETELVLYNRGLIPPNFPEHRPPPPPIPSTHPHYYPHEGKQMERLSPKRNRTFQCCCVMSLWVCSTETVLYIFLRCIFSFYNSFSFSTFSSSSSSSSSWTLTDMFVFSPLCHPVLGGGLRSDV